MAPVIAALNAMGVPARKSQVCDIAIGDLKISGNAQYRLGQLGSLICLDTDGHSSADVGAGRANSFQADLR